MNHPVEIVSQGIVAWQKLRCYNGIMNMNAVQLLSDEELVRNLESAVARERGATVQLIALLAEMDVRRLFLEQGHSSLFVYCTKCLHLSEHAAYGRIEAARAAQKFPSILDKLADGSITLTTICLLSNHLTEDNHERLPCEAQNQKGCRSAGSGASSDAGDFVNGSQAAPTEDSLVGSTGDEDRAAKAVAGSEVDSVIDRCPARASSLAYTANRATACTGEIQGPVQHRTGDAPKATPAPGSSATYPAQRRRC